MDAHRLLVVVLLAACNFQGKGKTDDASVIDASIVDVELVDAPDAELVDAPDAPPGSVCAGTGTFQICTSPVGLQDIAMLGGDLDTDTDARCNTIAINGMWTTSNQPPSCIIVAHDVTVMTTLVAHGDKPLVIFAHDVSVKALIDLTSRAADRGPGADLQNTCTAGTSPGANGGGAGGSFMTTGGSGGAANGGASAPGAPDAVAPSTLRGGCQGRDGDSNADGGHGGGSIFLAVYHNLSFMGIGGIVASGEGGGSAGNNQQGGGGGGSGGMIVLDAEMIMTAITTTIFANGAGGASGGDNNDNGSVGLESTNPNLQAAGGIGGSGGNGGKGYAAGTPASGGGGGGGNNGGGGGGGGGGYIHANLPLGGAIVSPPAS